MKHFAVLLIALFASSTALQIGESATFKANTEATANWGLLTPFSLTLTSDVDCTVTYNLVANLGIDLSNGLNSIGLSGGIGFSLTVNPPTAKVLKASITIPVPSINLGGNLASQLFFKADASNQQVSTNAAFYGSLSLDLDFISLTTKVDLPVNLLPSGTYFLASFKKDFSTPVPYLFNVATRVAANTKAALIYDAGLAINYTNTVTSNIKVQYSKIVNAVDAAVTAPAPAGYVALDAYFKIDASASSSSSNGQIQATIAFNLDSNILKAKGVAASNVKLAWWDETSKSWAIQATSRVEGEARVVATTNHFSTWAAFSSDATTKAASLLFIVIAIILTMA